jgi:transposase
MTKVEETKRTYRKYSKDLKQEVCSLADEGKQTYKELGDKFEIDPYLISKWMRSRGKDEEQAFRGRGNRTDLEAENARLRSENRDLRQEQEILKKAAAYFARNLR